MAQPFKVDIFSEDIDVVGPNVKPSIPPFLQHLNNYRPIPVQCRQVPFNLRQIPGNFQQLPVNFKNVPSNLKKRPSKVKTVPGNIKKVPGNNNKVSVGKQKERITTNPPKKKKAKAPKVKNPQPTPPKKQSGGWQPIPVLGRPDLAVATTSKLETKVSVNIEMERPNLKVIPSVSPTVTEGTAGARKQNLDKSKPAGVQNKPAPKPPEKNKMVKPDLKVNPGVSSTVTEGTAGARKLNLDKSKPTAVQKKTAPKPPEKNKANPEPQKVSPGESKSAPVSREQNKQQSSGVKGRMTASAFMNIDHLKSRSHGDSWLAGAAHLGFMQYPKGIPRSFLNKEHIQQLQSSTQQTATNPLSQGPVWEAKVPTSNAPTSWTTSLDQHTPMSGADAGQLGQHYQQEQMYAGQSYGASGHGFRDQQMFVQTDPSMDEISAQYSPSDAYADMAIPDSNEIIEDSAEFHQPGSKRLSAFQRLGPVTHPKKPKLTINLLLGKEEAVREVVDESEAPEDNKYTPVVERAEIQASLDDTVLKYLPFWPWKKPAAVRRTLSARDSRHIMQMELEQMDEHYEKDKLFFGISVTGYPESWNKEDVLDAILEAVDGKSFIPCFIEFGKNECKFLVIRSRAALLAIHKLGFTYEKEEVVLRISILHMNLSVNQLDFIPRLVLRKRLSMSMDGDTRLDLNHFTLAHDLSHFLYFPLSRACNQSELMQLQSSVPWHALTALVLSHNNITSVSGLALGRHTPRMKHLDLSHNRLESVTELLPLRALPLTTLALEGNPLCLDYIHPDRYIKVLKMMFSGLKEIDGVKVPVAGELPPCRRNYCAGGWGEVGGAAVAALVLRTLFPLLDAPPEERRALEDLYMDDAVLTITYMHKLRYSPVYKEHRALFSRARVLAEGDLEAVRGAAAVGELVQRWPRLRHDPTTFTVDLIYHTESCTIVRIGGVMKVSPERLAEEEHLVHFTRTLVLHAMDAREYRVTNELLHWEPPTDERAREAFALTTVISRNLNLKLDGPPDADLREKLLEIFMKLTDLGRNPSERCLESKDWHLKNALEYFTHLLKQDNLDPLFD